MRPCWRRSSTRPPSTFHRRRRNETRFHFGSCRARTPKPSRAGRGKTNRGVMTRSVLKRRFIILTPFPLSLVIAGALAGSLAAGACSRDSSSSSMTTPTTPQTTAAGAPTADRDVHSFAMPGDARVTHVALDLRADFTARRLTGKATLDLQRAPAATKVVLDTQDLDIRGVTDESGRALPFTLGN